VRVPPGQYVTPDIHCVTKWTKLDTSWTGVSLDTLLDGVGAHGEHVLVFSEGSYTTNLPLRDITGGKAWLVYDYEGEPLAPEHGGPARLLEPLAALRVHVAGPGVVARCRHCDSLLLVVVRKHTMACVDVSGFVVLDSPSAG
jgi:hypothetical protein